jgi:hypothetical protein
MHHIGVKAEETPYTTIIFTSHSQKRHASAPASLRVRREPHSSPRGLCARYTTNTLQREKAAAQAGVRWQGREKVALRHVGAHLAGDDLAVGGNRQKSNLGQQELYS